MFTKQGVCRAGCRTMAEERKGSEGDAEPKVSKEFVELVAAATEGAKAKAEVGWEF